MADAKDKLERVYTVNLSKAYTYLRTRRANRTVKLLREYLARHFKVAIENVKLSAATNSLLWRDSIQKPPRRIKVKGVRENGILQVSLADEVEIAQKVKTRQDAKKADKEKRQKARPAPVKKAEEKKTPAEKKPEAKAEQKKQMKEESKTAVHRPAEKKTMSGTIAQAQKKGDM
ncbi:MAG: 50S ribosomal protein L31e [Candidatus Micrarchaeia archaeon]